MTSSSIIIGTRASKLAMVQALLVKELLAKITDHSVEIKKITTQGDTILDRSLADIGGKGLFLKEIEEELLRGTIDVAVHSMKDVPNDMPVGLTIAAMLERGDPFDALISNRYASLQAMPDGAVIGTSSPRRVAQILGQFPKLKTMMLRGNVDTRLRKLDEGMYDALILACAGLKRLGLDHRITERLDFVPAVGQGTLGIQIKSDCDDLKNLFSSLNHLPTERAVNLERCFARTLKADCHTPIGCYVCDDPDHPDHFILEYFYTNSSTGKTSQGTISGLWSEGEKQILHNFACWR